MKQITPSKKRLFTYNCFQNYTEYTTYLEPQTKVAEHNNAITRTALDHSFFEVNIISVLLFSCKNCRNAATKKSFNKIKNFYNPANALCLHEESLLVRLLKHLTFIGVSSLFYNTSSLHRSKKCTLP